MRGPRVDVTIKTVESRGLANATSAARRPSKVEARQLAETAQGLPLGWVVAVEAPSGQLALVPRDNLHRQPLTWVADGEARLIYRQKWVEGTLRGRPTSVHVK